MHRAACQLLEINAKNNSSQPNKYDPETREKEWETWKKQALKLKKATRLVSMVTCRLYPDDVIGREKEKG